MWSGKYWEKGGLDKAREAFAQSEKTPADEIRFASQLYSAATRAAAETKHTAKALRLLRAFTWLWVFLDLAHEAVGHVDHAWEGKIYRDFTPDQVEASLAIWLRVGFLRGGRHIKARIVVENILFHFLAHPKEKEHVRQHTLGFLFSHAITSGHFSRVGKIISGLHICAQRAEKEGELAQASRVWRHAARHWTRLLGKNSQEAKMAYKEAMRLAKASNADDQIFKLSA
jgi:hypothetical protein